MVILETGSCQEKGDHGLFSQTPGTPLRALVDDTCDVHEEGLLPMSGLFASIVMRKVMFGYIPRV